MGFNSGFKGLMWVPTHCVTGPSLSGPEMDRRFRFKPWTGFIEINSFESVK